MREKVLRDLASRAATDAGFLKQARRDLKGTLAGFGYDLTLEELRLVEDLRRRTAAMSDEQLTLYLNTQGPRGGGVASTAFRWVVAKLGGLFVIGAESIYILAAVAPSWVRAGW